MLFWGAKYVVFLLGGVTLVMLLLLIAAASYPKIDDGAHLSLVCVFGLTVLREMPIVLDCWCLGLHGMDLCSMFVFVGQSCILYKRLYY